MRFFQNTLFLLAFLLLNNCTPDQRSSGRLAEQAYVDLFYAVHNEEEGEAKKAARILDRALADLRMTWQRPYAEERLEDIQYHLDQAGWVYADARASIEAEDLALAAIQLDRATYELTAASPAAMRELYIGSIYDFLITWLEVKHAVGEPDLCAMEWPEFRTYAKDVRINWRRVKNIRPNQRMYASTPPINTERFDEIHQKVDEELANFQEVLVTADQCKAAEAADQVSLAIWNLVLLFGTKTTTTAL